MLFKIGLELKKNPRLDANLFEKVTIEKNRHATMYMTLERWVLF